MDASAEIGGNLVSKHQIQPEYGDKQADAGLDCRTRLVRPNSQARTATGKYPTFPVQLTTSRIGNLTGLIFLLLNVITIHTVALILIVLLYFPLPDGVFDIILYEISIKKKTINHTTIRIRALSLRNLVSGYECGRVFPAGVGPGSPSRDATNWLPSRFSLSVATRRRYGWLRMVFPGARLFRAPI